MYCKQFTQHKRCQKINIDILIKSSKVISQVIVLRQTYFLHNRKLTI